MTEKKILPCPICGREHHIRRIGKTICICGQALKIERTMGKYELIPFDDGKTHRKWRKKENV